MGWLSELGRRLWMLSHGRQFDADLEEEIRLHLELREQDQMQAGLPPTVARHRALRQFGNEISLREKSHMDGDGSGQSIFCRMSTMACARCCAVQA
jgi:hypothetical protein